MSDTHRFACGRCNRPLSREEFIEALRNAEKLGPHGVSPVCDVCRERKAKGLPIERHGAKALCREDTCVESPHPVICIHCEKPVLAEDNLGPADGCEPNRSAGTFDHGGRHFACSNERAHRE